MEKSRSPQEQMHPLIWKTTHGGSVEACGQEKDSVSFFWVEVLLGNAFLLSSLFLLVS